MNATEHLFYSSTLVQVVARCRQATNHYLRSLSLPDLCRHLASVYHSGLSTGAVRIPNPRYITQPSCVRLSANTEQLYIFEVSLAVRYFGYVCGEPTTVLKMTTGDRWNRFHMMTSLCCRSIQSIRNDRTLGPTDVTLPTDAFHVVHMWSELLNEAESLQTYQGNTLISSYLR